MTAGKRLRLQNSMLLAMIGANLRSGLSNEMFGKQRGRERVRRHAPSDAPRIRDAMLKALRLFLGHRQAGDDITLMVVKILANDLA